MKFKVEKLENGLRFTAPDGWVDLQILGDGRAYIWCGTFNETSAEVFGARLWHLLRDAIPDLEIRVIAYDDAADPFVERILVAAGFTKDGTRRAWASGGQDGVLYSILATEVRYEVASDGNGQAGPASLALEPGAEESAVQEG